MPNEKGFKRDREIKLSCGKNVTILGIKLKSVPLVTTTVVPVLHGLASVEGQVGTGMIMIFSEILNENADNLFKIMSDTSSLTVEECENLDLDDGVDVLTNIYELNKEFFEKKILPLLQGLMPKEEKKKKAGSN